jgi:hypothetical protein
MKKIALFLVVLFLVLSCETETEPEFYTAEILVIKKTVFDANISLPSTESFKANKDCRDQVKRYATETDRNKVTESEFFDFLRDRMDEDYANAAIKSFNKVGNFIGLFEYLDDSDSYAVVYVEKD